ncbi:hypothetical protein [Oscillatoria sp. FACHB-1407]|nr:hypothetical protein [Oscillatoria sp. FACHB-1407]
MEVNRQWSLVNGQWLMVNGQVKFEVEKVTEESSVNGQWSIDLP